MGLDVIATPEGASFRVKVQAGAGGRTAAAGEWAGALKLKVGKPPERGAANRECLDYLARALGVPHRALEIVQGERSSLKVIRVAGATPEQVLVRLQAGAQSTARGSA